MQNFKGMLAEFYDQASMLLGLPDISFSPIDFIEILIIAFLFYHILLWIKSTKAWNLFKGIIVILLFVLVSAIFQMNTILWLAERTLNVGLIALVIIFQPELRKALENLGEKNFFGKVFNFSKSDECKFSDRTIEELIKACYAMGKVRTGALIVIEDEILLNEYIRTGIDIDAILSSQLLINIFEHNTPLHDGAVIIRGDRITSATCYLPLSDSSSLSKDLGTRHRAGLGISEVSDCIVVIVSEETGSISIAKEGKLIRYADAAILKNELIKAQDKEEVKPRRFLKGRGRNEKDVNETKDVSDK